MECQFCKNSFKNKSILKAHQQSAKYCLELQNANCDKFPCKFCGKHLASKQRLETHVAICNANTPYIRDLIAEKDKEIQELKDRIVSLKIKYEKNKIQHEQEKTEIYKEISKGNFDAIKEIAKQPRTQTNNQLLLMMPLDLSKERIKQTVEDKFTEQHFSAGQKGVAKFAVDNLLKDENGKLTYICTDPSRTTFKHRSSNGEVERDTKASKLTNLIVDDVVKKSTEIVNVKKDTATVEQFNTLLNNYTSIKQLSTDNCVFRSELAVLTVAK